VNFGDLIEECKDAVRSGNADEQAGRAINAAYQEATGRLRLLQRSQVVTVTAVQTTYSWADLGISDFVALVDLTRAGSDAVTVPGRQMADRDLVYATALNATISTLSATLYNVLGSAGIAFYPPPAVGETITILYAYRPDELSDFSDEPVGLPAEHHDILVDGALARLWRRNRGGSAMAAQCRKAFEEALGRIRADLHTIGGETPVGAVAGYPSLTRAVFQNDQYRSGA
jgi:hypothetical protein